MPMIIASAVISTGRKRHEAGLERRRDDRVAEFIIAFARS
jgi:hypothetical protein